MGQIARNLAYNAGTKIITGTGLPGLVLEVFFDDVGDTVKQGRRTMPAAATVTSACITSGSVLTRYRRWTRWTASTVRRRSATLAASSKSTVRRTCSRPSSVATVRRIRSPIASSCFRSSPWSR